MSVPAAPLSPARVAEPNDKISVELGEPPQVQPRQMFKRIPIVLIIGTFLLVLLDGGILAFANSYARADPHCFTAGFWHAQWPNWIGCVIAAHENLAAGLISSAVALFAAYLVWQKIQDAQKLRDVQDRRREEHDRRRERLEIKNIRRIVTYYNHLLEPFEPSGTDNINYLDVLNRAYTSGKFSRIPFGSVPAEYSFDAEHVWERLKVLNKAQKSGTGGEPDTNDNNNENIHAVLKDIRRYLDHAKEDLDDRETAAKQY